MKSILCLFGILSSLTVVQASTIDFAALVGQTVTLTVEPYSSGENNGISNVGLTEGYINNNPSESFWMFCDDAFDQIKTPATYDVTIVSLVNADFGGDNLGLSLAQLQQQATLGLNFGAAPSGNTAADEDTQQAIWNYTGGHFTPDAGMLADTAAMEKTYATGNYSGSFLLESTSEPGEQAFMPVYSAATPEPVSMLLLGSGLLVFGLFGRRRLRANR
jgi:hypothetical protein